MIVDKKPTNLILDRIPMQFYKVNQILGTLAGQWPFQGRVFKWFVFSLITGLTVFCCCMQTVYVFEINFELQLLIQIIPILACLLFLLLINLVLFWKRNECKHLWEIIADDWASERTTEETRIKESLARLSHLISKALTLTVGVGTVLFIIVSSCMSQIYDIIQPINGTRPIMLPFPKLL
ncbi:uncharacterized protein [Prorops nasuta]|uniref:uncharacterized protein n=1 Tax=Prorops nasuta TaxID=863751 RepID=UPI0034CFCC1C